MRRAQSAARPRKKEISSDLKSRKAALDGQFRPGEPPSLRQAPEIGQARDQDPRYSPIYRRRGLRASGLAEVRPANEKACPGFDCGKVAIEKMSQPAAPFPSLPSTCPQESVPAKPPGKRPGAAPESLVICGQDSSLDQSCGAGIREQAWPSSGKMASEAEPRGKQPPMRRAHRASLRCKSLGNRSDERSEGALQAHIWEAGSQS